MADEKRIRGKLYWSLFIFILAVTIVLNICAWMVPGFADLYRSFVFPLWGDTLGRLTAVFPFSVGEFMLFFGIAYLAAAFIAVLFILVNKIRKRSCAAAAGFIRGFAMTLDIVALVMTLNCFIVYHCSSFSSLYLEGDDEDSGYSYFELASVRDYVVDQVNELSKSMLHDADGNVIYNGSMDDMKAEAVRSMQKLGERYPEFSGHYNVSKGLACSDFMSQQNMRGYYFPFSMESNYNQNMTTVNMPSTMCHELAHTKGFMYEDEANFISYLACISSDNKYFQYSGYLSILNYLDNDFKTACGKGTFIYSSHADIEAQVKRDDVFLTAASRLSMEKNAVIPTKTVKSAAKTFINTNLVVNGIPDGEVSYSRVVGLMLAYYSGSDTMKYDEYMFASAK